MKARLGMLIFVASIAAVVLAQLVAHPIRGY